MPPVTDLLAAPLAPIAVPQSGTLGLYARRAAGSLVGRPVEIAALRQELASVRAGRLGAVTLEGEPGIGKTRLLSTVVEIAEAEGFLAVAVSADEEIRAPLLIARAIFSSAAARDATAGHPEADDLKRAFDACSGRIEPGFETQPRDERLLRAYDLCAIAFQGLAAIKPLAMFIDDAQWADEDSLRMLRYVVRTSGNTPIFLVLAIRPEETAQVREAVTFIADMERMGIVRRLELARFSQVETGQFLRQLLGGDIDRSTVATLHAQSEGVPFIAEELLRTYREAGMIQRIDSVWTAAKNADRLVPSAVRTLIERRAARLEAPSRVALAQAAILGRRFSLRDLSTLRSNLGEAVTGSVELTELLAPATAAGLLTAGGDAGADYRFPHEQVREQAMSALSPARQRAVHEAIIEMLSADGDPPPESLQMIALHALAAGNAELAGRSALAGAANALAANAPEEALRLVGLGLSSTTTPKDRVELLRVQDDALAALHRPDERLRQLAELEALAGALRDPKVELETMLRRAAAYRATEDNDRAADLARQVRSRAAAVGEKAVELQACLELGQALLGSSIGEAFVPLESEIDSMGAAEAYERALQLANELSDEISVAAASRELGVIDMAHVRAEVVKVGTSGQIPDDLSGYAPIVGPLTSARQRFAKALGIYEQLGDKRGVMLSIISLAYSTWGAEGYFGSVRHLEAIRRLNTLVEALTSESERAHGEAELLYSIEVYARISGVLDLALIRGLQAYQAARDVGDAGLEFVAAGGLAQTHLLLGETDEAGRWLDRAAAAAAAEPTPHRARTLELWRGRCAGRSGDAASMTEHLTRAATLAAEAGRPSARCEALSWLALESARLGALLRDDALLDAALRAAGEVQAMSATMPGKPPWPGFAAGAVVEVMTARGATAEALGVATMTLDYAAQQVVSEAAVGALTAYTEILLPVARVIVASDDVPRRDLVRSLMAQVVGLIAGRTADPGVFERWLSVPEHAELAEIAGGVEAARAAVLAMPETIIQQRLPVLPLDLDDDEAALLRLMMEGRSDFEIARELSLDERDVEQRLGETFAKIGAPNRSVATLYAFMADLA
jgi:DNA-binding NarL/FixJ family response regulator